MPERIETEERPKTLHLLESAMFALKHQLFDFLRLFGVRDRLRCPLCRAVGTWKPHGGWLDFEDERPVRRWLCKWCGVYYDADGTRFCEMEETCWEYVEQGKIMTNTPMLLLRASLERFIDPWRG